MKQVPDPKATAKALLTAWINRHDQPQGAVGATPHIRRRSEADVAAARAEGEASGRRAGAIDERVRIRSILTFAGARGKEALARQLAFSGATPTAAIAILGVSQAPAGPVAPTPVESDFDRGRRQLREMRARSQAAAR